MNWGDLFGFLGSASNSVNGPSNSQRQQRFWLGFWISIPVVIAVVVVYQFLFLGRTTL